MGLSRPSVEFAVRLVGELARAEGECILQTEDEYCKHTRSKDPLSPIGAHHIICDSCMY